MGKPIFTEKDENPSQDKINELHQRYMKELKELFDDNKAKYGYQDQTLEFIDWNSFVFKLLEQKIDTWDILRSYYSEKIWAGSNE